LINEMDYIGTNSQGTANAPNGMSDQLLGTWFQLGFPFPAAGHRAILPWPHVRNQEKRFAREHFAFAREQKRFACERFAFARQEKRFAREHFAFARQEKRFPREHFAFAREQKRFPRCRRTAVVFRRSLHALSRLRFAPPSPRGEGVFSIRSPHYGVKRIVLPPNFSQKSRMDRIYRRLSPLYKRTQQKREPIRDTKVVSRWARRNPRCAGCSVSSVGTGKGGDHGKQKRERSLGGGVR